MNIEEKRPYEMTDRYLFKLKIERKTNKIVEVESEIIEGSEICIPRMDPRLIKNFYSIWIRSKTDIDHEELQNIIDRVASNPMMINQIEIEKDISILQYKLFNEKH